MESRLSEILNLVDKYIYEKQYHEKWIAGENWVQYAKPFYSSKEYVSAVSAILSDWLVLGEQAGKFERTFPELLGKKMGILTNSGSSANLLMLSALKSKKLNNKYINKRVITPVAGFPTTINPILQTGFTPIFIDIELGTLNLDLNELEKAAKIYPGSILMFAHVLGNPTNMDKLMDIVKEYDLTLLEDCCDSLYSEFDRKRLGSFGLMSSVSFYPAHHITMGEGGFVATDSYELEKILRSFRDWGRGCYCNGKEANLLENGTCKCRFKNWIKSMPDEILDHKYIYEEIGYNLKPIEMQAALGLVQMGKINEIYGRRLVNHDILYNIFKKYEEHFMLPEWVSKSSPNWFAFALTMRDSSNIKRSDFCKYLESHKIQTRPYFAGNILLHPAYDHLYSSDMALSFKNATKSSTDTFFLGVGPHLTHEMMLHIESIVDKFFREVHI